MNALDPIIIDSLFPCTRLCMFSKLNVYIYATFVYYFIFRVYYYTLVHYFIFVYN